MIIHLTWGHLISASPQCMGSLLECVYHQHLAIRVTLRSKVFMMGSGEVGQFLAQFG